MLINIPASIHISRLREEFVEFCDQFNRDAILEPMESERSANTFTNTKIGKCICLK